MLYLVTAKAPAPSKLRLIRHGRFKLQLQLPISATMRGSHPNICTSPLAPRQSAIAYLVFCGNLPLAVRRWEGRPSWVDMLPSGPRRVRHVESGTLTRRAELRNVAHVKSQDPRVKRQYTPACRQRRTNHLMALPRPMTNEEAVKTRDCSGLPDFSALSLSWSVCRIVITYVLVQDSAWPVKEKTMVGGGSFWAMQG